MDVSSLIKLLVVIFSIVASFSSSVKKSHQEKRPQQQVPDWKKVFEKTPSKLEGQPKKPAPQVPDTREIAQTIKREEPAMPAPSQEIGPTESEKTRSFMDWETDKKEVPQVVVSEVPNLAAKQKKQEPRREDYSTAAFLKRAVIAKEILDKPRALNPWRAR
ncbi:MAG TPA: hypothetical protein PLN81_00545 [Bacillota bacterium]|nr:hypothetical protein [Bacillota bacterium]HOP54786.1 hypothetical protein [Bacillota bacterium]HPT60065.1 hypothetical protein [Bacillota bacterium]